MSPPAPPPRPAPRQLAPLLPLLLLLRAFAPAAARSPGHGARPHIVFFLVDDVGWFNVGWHNRQMITPFSDELVKQGVELNRHYVYRYCAPSRGSLMSGRLPYHVNQVILPNWCRDWNMPREMTALPAKLKQAGYAAHMVGKWHVGLQSEGETPHGRGFDSFFGFFDGAEDHWTQASCLDGICNLPSKAEHGHGALSRNGWPNNTIDLWCTDRPCWGRVGTTFRRSRHGLEVGDEEHYGDWMFTQEAVRLIDEHEAEVPLFLVVSFGNDHTPLQVPEKYVEMYPARWRSDRRWYAAMTTYWDECVGNITRRLRQRGMWSNTLVVLTADNGGPAYWKHGDVAGPVKEYNRRYWHGAAGNNWPLRGSKTSDWEGGVRVAAFAAGGFLPPQLRGKKLHGYIHIVDWYATFCHLAGVDPRDPNLRGARSDGTPVDLPPVDSLNLWPWLLGNVARSPRQEIPLAIEHPQGMNSALIVGKHKLLLGTHQLSYWQGPEFPNGTGPYGLNWGPKLRCGARGCLFDVREDPAETVDLVDALPDVVLRLKRRFRELRQTVIQQADAILGNQDCPPPLYGGYCAASREFVRMLRRNRGFVGPFLPDSPPPPAPEACEGGALRPWRTTEYLVNESLGLMFAETSESGDGGGRRVLERDWALLHRRPLQLEWWSEFPPAAPGQAGKAVEERARRFLDSLARPGRATQNIPVRTEAAAAGGGAAAPARLVSGPLDGLFTREALWKELLQWLRKSSPRVKAGEPRARWVSDAQLLVYASIGAEGRKQLLMRCSFDEPAGEALVEFYGDAGRVTSREWTALRAKPLRLEWWTEGRGRPGHDLRKRDEVQALLDAVMTRISPRDRQRPHEAFAFWGIEALSNPGKSGVYSIMSDALGGVIGFHRLWFQIVDLLQHPVWVGKAAESRLAAASESRFVVTWRGGGGGAAGGSCAARSRG